MDGFSEKLEKLLKSDKRFCDVDGGLLKSEVVDKAYRGDEKLAALLLGNAEMRRKFFSNVEGHAIFKTADFVSYISDKHFLNDSYTQFKNKIGLTIGGKFLSERKEVELVWPFKDCVLEGGMTREDEKRKEIFFNETLAQDEIDTLFAPKVLTNWKRYAVKGAEKVSELNRGKDGTIKENLIIKGNNLLALHSLKEQFLGKVKLIYIDPPYNTGSDGFKYNDSFNHSSWLVFMKNRLEVAKTLLKDDGFIFVQCDDNEQSYLKVLLDDIFGRDNYRNSIYWHRTYAGKTISKNLPWNVDTILFYSKNPNSGINNITKELTEIDIASFTKDDNDGKGKYTTVSLQKTGGPGPQTTYPYKDNKGRIWKCPVKGWRMTKEKLKALENAGRLYITDKTIREKYYLNERLEIGKQIDNLWRDIGNMNRSKSEDTGFSGQKPEKLLQRIIDLTTNTDDLVLDFFAGTGTTLATAHKIGRRYIGIEQMDYIHDLPEARLKKVIAGEQGGISKDVSWKGGGDFVYCELMKYNERFIDEIKATKDTKALLKIWEEIKKHAFVKYNVDLQAFDKNIMEFKKLPLAEQKKTLLQTLDKNQLYVNLSEVDDVDFKVVKGDKEMNKEFYGRF
jgi:adenine-specific DNA-methyltransferase